MPRFVNPISALLVGAALLGAGWFVTRPLTAQAPASPPAQPDPALVLADVTPPATLSPNAQLGQRLFDAACSACHGPNAAGQDGFAPPLIHRIYEPSHHGDEAFQIAVSQGVRAHHWRFGNMPPVEGLTRGDVSAIVAYVREVQRANGIN